MADPVGDDELDRLDATVQALRDTADALESLPRLVDAYRELRDGDPVDTPLGVQIRQLARRAVQARKGVLANWLGTVERENDLELVELETFDVKLDESPLNVDEIRATVSMHFGLRPRQTPPNPQR